MAPSSFTRLGWFRLPPIDQYSSLLPPVGVWSVSQYQCGDLPLRTPTHRRLGGPLPRLPNAPHAHPPPVILSSPGDAPRDIRGISLPFGRLSLWRAGCIRVTHPCASRRQRVQSTLPLPFDLHVLKPAASVHPEPGSNSPLLVSCFQNSSNCSFTGPGFLFPCWNLDGTSFICPCTLQTTFAALSCGKISKFSSLFEKDSGLLFSNLVSVAPFPKAIAKL